MSSTLRSALFTVLLGGAVLGGAPAWADSHAATSGGRGYEETLKVPAGKFIQDMGNSVIGIIADKGTTPEQRSDKFREILSDSFDLQTIGHYVIGRAAWNSATPDQRQEYMRLFKELVIKTYGARMTLYTGEGFQVTSARPESETDWTVTSQITHPDGSQPTEIDWRLHDRNGKLGVIDVVVEGVSLSVTQKQEYAAVIQRNGGKIDGLLTEMRQQLQSANVKTNQPG